MSEKNRRLLIKDTVVTTTGGQLTPDQAKQFINTVIDESEMLQKVSTVTFEANEYHIDSIGIAGRQMRQAVEDVEPNVTASATIPRRKLNTVEVILPYDISLNFLEENIERGAAEAKLNTAFATQFGNDVLDLAIEGNEASADEFVKINDGWVQIALDDTLSNKADITGLTDPKAILKALLSAHPTKYKRNKPELVFLVPPDFEQEYRSGLGERATALGDAYLTESRSAYYQGIEVYPVPYMTGAIGNPMLTTWKNLIIGFGRQMRQDRRPIPRKRIMEYTITAKFDVNYAVSELMTIGTATP